MNRERCFSKTLARCGPSLVTTHCEKINVQIIIQSDIFSSLFLFFSCDSPSRTLHFIYCILERLTRTFSKTHSSFINYNLILPCAFECHAVNSFRQYIFSWIRAFKVNKKRFVNKKDYRHRIYCRTFATHVRLKTSFSFSSDPLALQNGEKLQNTRRYLFLITIRICAWYSDPFFLVYNIGRTDLIY